MNRKFKLMIKGMALLGIVGLLSSCGGGGGGGGGLITGGFIKTVVLDGTNSSWGWPFTDNNPETRFQMLYRASEIKGAGQISSISFQHKVDDVLASCPNITVRMGHTSFAALTNAFADNVEQGKGSFETVLNNSAVPITAGLAGDYFDINLDTPFNYNGVDNLVVEIESSAACDRTIFVDATNESTPYTAIVTSSSLTAPTGALFDVLPHLRFDFSGGDNAQDHGGLLASTHPFIVSGSGGRTQSLLLASEINGAGSITGIAYQTAATTVAGTYSYTLRLGHSTLTTLGTTFASNYSDSPVTVANAVANFTIPAGIPAGEWLWVPIPDGVFTYNGTDNLIVDMTTTAASALNLARYTTTGTRTVVETDATALMGSGASAALHFKLRFNGGPVTVITNGVGAGASAFSVAANGMLNLYRASELGTAGTINSIACRTPTNTAATSYDNYKVIIGHSTVDTLSATATDNFVSQTTAVSGTVTVPAGLLAGDWIEVPLSTPFAYDGVSNLAIWMGTTAAGAATSHWCINSSPSDITRYPGQQSRGAPGVAIVSVEDYKFDIKLGISK